MINEVNLNMLFGDSLVKVRMFLMKTTIISEFWIAGSKLFNAVQGKKLFLQKLCLLFNTIMPGGH